MFMISSAQKNLWILSRRKKYSEGKKIVLKYDSSLNPSNCFFQEAWRKARGEMHHLVLVGRIWRKGLRRWHQLWGKVAILAPYPQHMDAHSELRVWAETIHLFKGLNFDIAIFEAMHLECWACFASALSPEKPW